MCVELEAALAVRGDVCILDAVGPVVEHSLACIDLVLVSVD